MLYTRIEHFTFYTIVPVTFVNNLERNLSVSMVSIHPVTNEPNFILNELFNQMKLYEKPVPQQMTQLQQHRRFSYLGL